MGAGRRRKSVIDVNIAERRQGSGKFWVVFLLAGVKAGILQQRHVASAERIDHAPRLVSDAIGNKCDSAAA
jgi:hypothetical protein